MLGEQHQRPKEKEQETNKKRKLDAKSGLIWGEQMAPISATSEFLYSSGKVSSTKLKQVLLTPLTELELMARKLMIELAREIVGGVEEERERKEKDRETAEVVNPMEMEEQEVEESVERKALVQLSRLLEKADRKSRKEERERRMRSPSDRTY